MMNLPLLYRAADEMDDNRYRDVAMKHADKTMLFQVRGDGSCSHINEYNPETGEFITSHTGQGYPGYAMSSWSRGQAWGIYGFALSYRNTGKMEYLETAKKIAHYFMVNIAETDYLPLCDFRAPKEPVIYDSTAGACAVCGLIEIAEQVPEFEKELYFNFALKMLKALERRFCSWSERDDYILGFGTEAYGRNEHIPIIYGDFFFTEAICKLMGYDKHKIW